MNSGPWGETEEERAAGAGSGADRMEKWFAIGDKLLDKLDLAADQLNRTLITHKRKTKTLEYDDPDARGKPAKEIILEEEIPEDVPTPIDRQGLQQLSVILKNLRDALGPERNEAAGENRSTVTFEGDAKEWAE